ncbi:MAG: hypothetical protein AAGG51_19870 [Cyanobacteria bacterium P01_G01_bin.54]
MKKILLKQSRRIHHWVSFYVVLIALIWIIESLIIPPFFNAGMPVITSDRPTPIPTEEAESPLTFEQAQKVFMAQNPPGIQSFEEVDEIDYFPALNIYRLKNNKRFFEWHLNAYNGALTEYGFNQQQFVMQKGYMGWLHPWLGYVVKHFSSLLSLILVGSGCLLLLSPLLIKMSQHQKSLSERDVIH